MKRLLALVAPLLAVACHAQTGFQPDFVLSGETAYGLAPAEVICGGACQNLSWSDDGRFVCVMRMDFGTKAAIEAMATSGMPADAEESVVVFDTKTRKSTVLWRSKVVDATLSGVSWLAGSTVMVGVAERNIRQEDPNQPPLNRSELVIFSAASGSSKALLSSSSVSYGVMACPTKPLALVTEPMFVPDAQGPGSDQAQKGYWEIRYRVLTADGRLSQPLNLPKGAHFQDWSEDGADAIFMTWSRDVEGKAAVQQRQVNLANGASVSIKSPKPYIAKPKPSALYGGPASGSVTVAKTTRDIKPGWISTADGESQALVAGNVSEMAISPSTNAVAYVSEGAALVRTIVQLPKDVVLKAKAAAERARVMSNAKQCGLALLMYASDMDDTLPSNTADVANLMYPYTKNRDLTNGFVYTYGGGLMTDIKNPAETIMGYMPGPGGKAVVYTDGHVKWQPDQ